MPPYRIVEWEKYYETSETRRGKVKKMTWVGFPNKHDGEGFSRLMQLKRRGVEYFGAAILMIEVASKCEPRGLLVRDDGTPHTPESLSAKTRAPAQSFKSAIPKLIDVGWIEDLAVTGDAETSGDLRSRPENSAYPTRPDQTLPDPTRPDQTDADREEVVAGIYEAYPRKAAKQASLRETSRALDLLSKRSDVEDPPAWLLQRVEEYAESPAGQKPAVPADDRRWFCRTWMKDGHYDDDPTEWQRPNGRGVQEGKRVGQGQAGRGRGAAEARRAEKAAGEFAEDLKLP